MQEHERVNQQVGEGYNSFEDGAAELVKWSNQFVDQDWLMFIGILMALVLFGMMGLRNSAT